MSKTGTYVFDGEKMVIVSRETPKLASRIDGVYFRQPYIENFGGGGSKPGIEITSKSHKKRVMAERGIAEFEESSDIKPERLREKLYFIPKEPKGKNLNVQE